MEPFVKQFEALDKDGNGRLNRADLEIISKTYRQRGSITGVDNAAAARLAESLKSIGRSSSLVQQPKHTASDLSRVVSKKVSRMVSVSSVGHEVLEEEQALQTELKQVDPSDRAAQAGASAALRSGLDAGVV